MDAAQTIANFVNQVPGMAEGGQGAAILQEALGGDSSFAMNNLVQVTIPNLFIYRGARSCVTREYFCRVADYYILGNETAMRTLVEEFKSWKSDRETLRVSGGEDFSSALVISGKKRLRNRYAVLMCERLLYSNWERVGELIVFIDERGRKKLERALEDATTSMKGEDDERDEWWSLFDRRIAPASPALTITGAFSTQKAFLRFVGQFQEESRRSFKQSLVKCSELNASEYEDVPLRYFI